MTIKIGDLVVSTLVPVPKSIAKVTDTKQKDNELIYKIHIERTNNIYWVHDYALRPAEPEELI